MMVANNLIFGKKYGYNFLTGLIAYYPFNGNSNDSINSHNGVDTSVTYTTGIDGNALTMTAQNQYVTISDNDVFSFTDGTNDLPFTICLNLYTTGYSSSSNRFLSKRIAGNGLFSEYMFICNSTAFGLYLYSGGNSISSKNFLASHSMSLSTWYNIAISYDGTNLKLYIDGIEVTGTQTQNGSYTSMINISNNLVVGKMEAQANSNHLGKIDNLAIWKNRQLTSAEIYDLYTKIGNPLS